MGIFREVLEQQEALEHNLNLKTQKAGKGGRKIMVLQNFWQEQIEPIYKNGLSHTFLLSLNVGDIVWDEVYGYFPMMEYLMEEMNALGIEAVAGVRGGQMFLPKPGRITAPQRHAWKLDGASNERKKINESLDFDGTKVIKPDKPHEWMPGKLNDLFYETRISDLSVGLVIYPIENHEYLLNNLKSWATDFELRGRGCAIILTTFNTSPPDALTDNSEIKVLRVPYPDYEDRLQLIKHLISRGVRIDTFIPPEQLSELTSGLELITIYPLSMWADGAKEYKGPKEKAFQVFLDLIEERKRASIKTKSNGMLEVMETTEYSFDMIGGLDNVKNYLKEITVHIVKKEGLQVPTGVLFLGPSGTGKTIVARALARESGMTCVQLRNIKEVCSGQNISVVIELIQMLAPVLVFIDDIDKPEGISWGSGQNSTTPIPLELLVFMGNPKLRGKVLWVGASNRPDLIDVEFTKYGVFEEKLVFLLPDKNERADILQKMFIQNEIPFDNGLNFSNVTDDKYTQGYAASELNELAKRSYRLARLNGRDSVSEQDVITAAESFISKYDPNMSEYTSLLAIREVNSKDMLPQTLPPNLGKVVYEGNNISKEKINKRLSELASKLKL